MTWLSSVLPDKMPKGVVAFYIGISELVDQDDGFDYYGIGIMGTQTYHAADSDWACEGIWRPLAAPEFLIPTPVYANEWEKAEAGTVAMVEAFIANPNNPGAKVLRQSRCVAVGFPDGDLIEVWPKKRVVSE